MLTRDPFHYEKLRDDEMPRYAHIYENVGSYEDVATCNPRSMGTAADPD
ncbi:hypothetical protein [Endozoicomonas sp. ONNA2]|nr:hypothetical protein [Endozoicomonas sp. ONNA2]